MTIPFTTLKKRSEFLSVAASNKKFVTRSMVVQYIHNSENADNVRIGYTVTKKQGNAVMRNRMKRRMRAAVREIFGEHAKAGYDYVLIGRWQLKDYKFEALKNDMIFALGHIHKKRHTEKKKDDAS